MTEARALVVVIDDDESVRESLPDLLRVAGYAVRAFPSAEAFLADVEAARGRCLVLDVAMPGLSGPDLVALLARQGRSLPAVFITANGDESLRARLIEQGAVDCLFKPFTDAALLQAVASAVRQG